MAKQYTLKIDDDILAALNGHDVEVDTAAEFFFMQVESMLNCPPNYRLYAQKEPIWIMRGYFPGTTQFFKIVILDVENISNAPGYKTNGGRLFAKVSHPKQRADKRHPKAQFVESRDIQAYLEQKAENSLLDVNVEVKPLVNKVHRLRCMSPKGMPIHGLKRKKRK